MTVEVATVTRLEMREQKPPMAHICPIEDPTRAICGARSTGQPPLPGAGRCVVCLDLVRHRGFVAR